MKKILIVEDDLILLNLLKDKLIKAGFNVVTVEKGSLVLHTIEEERPDLVLLDLVLPDMNGLDILEEIRNNVLLVSVPVMIVSNSGEHFEIDKAQKLGVSGYLIKTEFDPQEVVDKVNNFFNQVPAQKQDAAEEKVKSDFPKENLASDIRINKVKVMIVEDDKFLRELISQKIIKEGMDVALAASAEEAEEKIKKEKPTIILLDIILPGKSGFDFLKMTKSVPSLSDIPVIILSNLGEEKERETAINLGAKRFLIKAMHTPNEIMGEIKHVLEESYL